MGSNSFESIAIGDDYIPGFGVGPAIRLYETGIVPQTINFIPYLGLYVYYPGGIQVAMGDELTAEQTANPPIKVELSGNFFFTTDKKGLYTLLFLDLDDPSPDDPVNYEFLQWAVVNIPAEDLFRGTDTSNGTVLAPYKSPYTAKGTHRYVFVLLQQKQGPINTPQISDDKRNNFSLRVFGSRNHLRQAEAINFFTSQPAPAMR